MYICVYGCVGYEFFYVLFFGYIGCGMRERKRERERERERERGKEEFMYRSNAH